MHAGLVLTLVASLGLFAPAGRMIKDNAQWVNLNAAGSEFFRSGNLVDAQRRYEQALQVAEPMGQHDPEGLAITIERLAIVYRAQGKYGKAEPLFLRALGLREKVYRSQVMQDKGAQIDALAMCRQHVLVGDFYREQGKDGKAEPLYAKAFVYLEESDEPDPRARADLLLKQGMIAVRAKKHDKAAQLLAEVVELEEGFLADSPIDEDRRILARALEGLGDIRVAKKDLAGAEPFYKRSLAMTEQAYPSNDRAVVASLRACAAYLRKAGKKADADRLEARAKAIPVAK